MFHTGPSRPNSAAQRPSSGSPNYIAPSLEPFSFERLLGEGTYAKVYKVSDKTVPKPNTKNFAVKCISRSKVKSKTAVDILVNEIAVLKKLKNPHIVQMLSFEWDQHFIYIVMEFCPCGDFSVVLNRSRGKVTESEARYYFRQLAYAMCYLNEENVMHLDLKPKNLLLTHNKQLKVADFGFALVVNNLNQSESGGGGQSSSEAASSDHSGFLLRGTPLYMAPEIVKNAAARSPSPSRANKRKGGGANKTTQFDARSDLWSCGVILYETLFAKWPVSGSTSQEVLEKLMRLDSHSTFDIPSSTSPAVINKKPQPFAANSVNSLSSECIDLLARLLTVDMKRRITFDELRRHPFVDLKSYRQIVTLKSEADEAFLQATQFASSNSQNSVEQWKTAIDLYVQGAKIMMDIVQSSTLNMTELERNLIRKEATCYTEKAEKLKNRIEGFNAQKSTDKVRQPNTLKRPVSPNRSSKRAQSPRRSQSNREKLLDPRPTSSCASNKKLQSLFLHGEQKSKLFVDSFKLYDEILEKYERCSRDYLWFTFLKDCKFDECKNHLVAVVEFYRDWLNSCGKSRVGGIDESLDERVRMLKEERLRLVEIAEVVMKLKMKHEQRGSSNESLSSSINIPQHPRNRSSSNTSERRADRFNSVSISSTPDVVMFPHDANVLIGPSSTQSKDADYCWCSRTVQSLVESFRNFWSR